MSGRMPPAWARRASSGTISAALPSRPTEMASFFAVASAIMASASSSVVAFLST
ncbi:hypothetical protein D3C81_2171810 [compost metagenome]